MGFEWDWDYKYGIPKGVCGVYMITNKNNGKRYVGASTNISSRLSNHFNREAKKRHTQFNKDVDDNGYLTFEWEVLEECDPDSLFERESYYLNKLKPEYNIILPGEFQYKEYYYTDKQIEAHERRKNLYRSEDYIETFRSAHTKKMRPCILMTEHGEEVIWFRSLQEASRWLDDNTAFTGKNKTSKVKSVCDGNRERAYGFRWRYADESVTTIQMEYIHY